MKRILLAVAFLLACVPAWALPEVVLSKDNTIVLNQDINEESAPNLAFKARELDANLPSGYPIYLVLDTPGGYVEEAVRAIGVLKTLNRPIHTVTIFSASMGFHTVQALGTRYILAHGTLMSHRARGGFFGEMTGSLDTRYDYYLKRITALDEQVVARTGGKYTLQTYRNLIQNEFWCDGQECVDKGFADAVVTARCDATLSGTRDEKVMFYFAGMRIELVFHYAACPIITSPLGVDIIINGSYLYPSQELKAKGEYAYDRVGAIDKEVLDKINSRVQQEIKNRTDKTVRAY